MSATTTVGPKTILQKMKVGSKYKWFKISYLQFYFQNYFFGRITSFIFVHTFQWTSSEFFLFQIFSRKSQGQQRLAKKITHFTIQFCSKNLTHFTNLNSLHIENNMLPKKCQKSFSLHKFPSKHVWSWPSKVTCFRNYGLQKAGLLKCLKRPVSKHLWTVNMLKAPKHCINLHGCIFVRFSDHTERKSVRKFDFSSTWNLETVC